MRLWLLMLYPCVLQGMHVTYKQDIEDLFKAIQGSRVEAFDLLKKDTNLANADFASLCKEKGDTSGTNETPLLYCIRPGNYPAGIFLELLRCGADVNTASSKGMTPLLKAIINQQFNIATVLLEKDANTYAQISLDNNKIYDAHDLAKAHLSPLVPLIEQKRSKAKPAVTPAG